MQKTVTTTAARLDSGNVGEIVLLRDATATIYLGGSNVTVGSAAATDGWPFKAADQPMQFRVPSTGLWARVGTGTPTVEVLQLGL